MQDAFRKRLHSIWAGMKDRCQNRNAEQFRNYGGKNVFVCQEWDDSFSAFAEWALANGYGAKLQLDRIDPAGSYCPQNCRWATVIDQALNRRVVKRSRYIGVCFHKTSGLWRSRIRLHGKGRRKFLGYFKSEAEAAEAYRVAFREVHGVDLESRLIRYSAAN